MFLTESPLGRCSAAARLGGRTAHGITLALVLAGAAWAMTGPGPAGPSRTGAPTITAGVREVPPIYQLFRTWTADDQKIELAKGQLIHECMANSGLSYDPNPPVADEADQPAPFGLESLTRRESSTAADEPSGVPAGESERFARALYGDPTDRVTVDGRTLTTAL